MIYCSCHDCGLKFRKGHYKNPRCLRCGSDNLVQEDIPASEITLAERIADKMLRETLNQR